MLQKIKARIKFNGDQKKELCKNGAFEGYDYREALDIVEKFLEYYKSKGEAELFLNYVIETVKRDIETSNLFPDNEYRRNNDVKAIESAVYDSKRAFELFDTDGEYWRYKGEVQPPKEMEDMRYTLLFQLEKMLYETEKQDNMQEP